jgi:hypothetical protein
MSQTEFTMTSKCNLRLILKSYPILGLLLKSYPVSVFKPIVNTVHNTISHPHQLATI